jgi:uncharacterized protein involved in exopolysaccharide biosynthesis
MNLWIFIQFLWRAKFVILASVIVAVAIAWGMIAAATPKFRAQAVLRTVSTERYSSLTSMTGNLSGLASLAGINLGGDENLGLAVGTLKARSFVAQFITEHDLLPVLFPERWNATTKAWNGAPPTISQAVDMFDRGGIRKVIEDRRTGFVVLQVEWHDPDVANQWLVSMVASVNKTLREQKLREASESVAFLEKQLAQTAAVEVRQAAFRLMEVQMKDMMIASTQEQYALKYVDPPIKQQAPQDRVWPRPLLMTAAAIMLGGMIGLLLAFVFYAQSSPLVAARATRSGIPPPG